MKSCSATPSGSNAYRQLPLLLITVESRVLPSGAEWINKLKIILLSTSRTLRMLTQCFLPLIVALFPTCKSATCTITQNSIHLSSFVTMENDVEIISILHIWPVSLLFSTLKRVNELVHLISIILCLPLLQPFDNNLYIRCGLT